MKKPVFTLTIIFIVAHSWAQQADTLKIDECLRMAADKSPLNQQKVISADILQDKIRNINTNWLPAVGLNAQASYNSETVDFSDIMGRFNISIPSLPLDQYKLWADINQQIYDGGMNRALKDIEKTGYEAELHQTEAELLGLRQQVNQVYFSLLLTQKNDEILSVSLNQLEERKKVLQAGVTDGIVLPENLMAMEAEEIAIQQKITELKITRQQLLNTLSILMDSTLSPEIIIAEPADPSGSHDAVRPELLLFDMQRDLLRANQKLLSSADMPKLFAFSQVAYGRPGYNMLSNDFHTFYTVGAGLKWNFLNYGDNRRQKKILEVQKDLVEIKRENFNDKLTIQLETEKMNMDKYDELILQDEKILQLRKSISAKSLSRLNNGTITATDYLTDMNAEILSDLQLQNHKIMRIQASFNFMLLQGSL
jgi:outer membrane protein TolC